MTFSHPHASWAPGKTYLKCSVVTSEKNNQKTILHSQGRNIVSSARSGFNNTETHKRTKYTTETQVNRLGWIIHTNNPSYNVAISKTITAIFNCLLTDLIRKERPFYNNIIVPIFYTMRFFFRMDGWSKAEHTWHCNVKSPWKKKSAKFFSWGLETCHIHIYISIALVNILSCIKNTLQVK